MSSLSLSICMCVCMVEKNKNKVSYPGRRVRKEYPICQKMSNEQRNLLKGKQY